MLEMTEWKKSSYWYYEDVRQMCIDQDYYTCGDVKAYDNMLEYVRSHKEPTEHNILTVVKDIYDHSDVEGIADIYGVDSDQVFSSIYFNLVNDVVKFGIQKQ